MINRNRKKLGLPPLTQAESTDFLNKASSQYAASPERRPKAFDIDLDSIYKQHSTDDAITMSDNPLFTSPTLSSMPSLNTSMASPSSPTRDPTVTSLSLTKLFSSLASPNSNSGDSAAALQSPLSQSSTTVKGLQPLGRSRSTQDRLERGHRDNHTGDISAGMSAMDLTTDTQDTRDSHEAAQKSDVVAGASSKGMVHSHPLLGWASKLKNKLPVKPPNTEKTKKFEAMQADIRLRARQLRMRGRADVPVSPTINQTDYGSAEVKAPVPDLTATDSLTRVEQRERAIGRRSITATEAKDRLKQSLAAAREQRRMQSMARDAPPAQPTQDDTVQSSADGAYRWEPGIEEGNGNED